MSATLSPLAATTCSSSKVEEIIAMLWTILWAILWANDAHPFALWFVGTKATLDHLTAILFAIREIRRENNLFTRKKCE